MFNVHGVFSLFLLGSFVCIRGVAFLSIFCSDLIFYFNCTSLFQNGQNLNGFDKNKFITKMYVDFI